MILRSTEGIKRTKRGAKRVLGCALYFYKRISILFATRFLILFLRRHLR